MLQRRRDPVRAGRRPCSALLAPFGRDRALEYTLQGLEDVQMDPVERPAAAADRRWPVYQVDDRRSSVRPVDFRVPQTPPNTRHARRVPEAGTADFPRTDPDPPLTPKPARGQFEKSSFRWPARREPGRRPRAYIQPFVLPREANTGPLRASFFSESTRQEQNGPTPGAEEPARQHPGPPDVPAARKSGTSSPPGGFAAGNILAARLGL